MNYGEVLTNSWKTIWKHKVLWIFGILAGLGSGAGSSNGGGSASRGMPNNGDFPRQFNFNNLGERAGYWLQNNWWVILILVVLAVLLVAVVIILSTYGRIGLARGAWQADDGAPRLTFSGLFSESGRYFWRVFFLAALIVIVFIVLTILIVVPSTIFAVATLGVGLICLVPFICVLGLLGWIVQIVIRLAIIAIVGEDLGVMAGLTRGWEVARDHLGETIVMGLILGIGAGVVHFVIFLPFLAALLPLVGLLFDHTSAMIRTSLIAAGVLFCLYLPVAICLVGVVEAYVGATWTLTFRRLTGRTRATAEVVSGSA